MRITKLMGLAVLVVALAVVINTLALSSATVNNTFSIGVVNSATALLAVSAPTTPDTDFTIDDTGSKFSLSLEHGVQADSTYVFGQAFKITNNSDNKTVTLGYTLDNPTANMTVTLHNASGGANITGLTLAPGISMDVTMQIVTTGAATNSDNKTSLTITGN